jgi:hypothetical protein
MVFILEMSCPIPGGVLPSALEEEMLQLREQEEHGRLALLAFPTWSISLDHYIFVQSHFCMAVHANGT